MKIKMNEKERKEFTGYIERIVGQAAMYPANSASQVVTENVTKLPFFISKVARVKGKGRKSK